MNRLHKQKEQIAVEVKRESNFAQKRLQMANRKAIQQKERADSLEVILEAQEREEIVWMARALYSETKRPHEMWHVGWVIRNRFDSGFRSGETYRSVILHPKQFSAFNRGSPMRSYYFRLEPKDVAKAPRWHDALATAKRVIDSPRSFRPFPADTLHFYSRRSMSGEPYWKNSLTPVSIASIENDRFNFLRGSGVSTTSITSTAR